MQDWIDLPADDPLDVHRDELCRCGHPVGDHQIDDDCVGPCLSCNCDAMSDGGEW